jgi:hypothetical protein
MIYDILVSVLGWAPLFIVLCLFVWLSQRMSAGSLKRSEARMNESVDDQKEILAVAKEIRDLLKKGRE